MKRWFVAQHQRAIEADAWSCRLTWWQGLVLAVGDLAMWHLMSEDARRILEELDRRKREDAYEEMVSLSEEMGLYDD